MVETDILPGDRPPSVAEVSLGGLPLKVSPGKGNETAVPRSGSIDAQGLVAAVFGGRLWQQTGGVWPFSLAFALTMLVGTQRRFLNKASLQSICVQV